MPLSLLLINNNKYMIADNVQCNNCGFDGLVPMGAEVCPKCRKHGALAWKEGEPEEVETEKNIKTPNPQFFIEKHKKQGDLFGTLRTILITTKDVKFTDEVLKELQREEMKQTADTAKETPKKQIEAFLAKAVSYICDYLDHLEKNDPENYYTSDKVLCMNDLLKDIENYECFDTDKPIKAIK